MVFAVVCVLTGAPRAGERFCGSHWIPVVACALHLEGLLRALEWMFRGFCLSTCLPVV